MGQEPRESPRGCPGPLFAAQTQGGARQRPTRSRSGGSALEVTSACTRGWKSPLQHHGALVFLLRPARPLPPEIPQHMAGGFPPLRGDGPNQPHGLEPSTSQCSTSRDRAGHGRGHGDRGGTVEADPSRNHSRGLSAGAATGSGAATIRPSLCVQPSPALSLLEFSPRRALIS